jgi:hypothetical protein
MAELTIHKHDGKTDASGAAMIIRDSTGCHIKEAKKIVEACKAGSQRIIRVPYVNLSEVAAKLRAKGFTTS